MHRNNILDLLEQYKPYDEMEVGHKNKMQTFVTSNSDCFERSLEIGHMTGSAWLLNRDKELALLMHHRKLDSWFQLGGHCDGDHDVMAVAIKEAQEESGMINIIPVTSGIFDIDVHYIPENKSVAGHYHYDVRFLLKVTSDEEPVLNHEARELRWFGKNDTLPTSEQSVLRMFDKWKNLSS